MTPLPDIPADRPVLIAGPTASGKSALALAIAERSGGVIVNADAIQVYANWRVLTARPGAAELARAPHRLYGHVDRDTAYSAGRWLRDLAPILRGGARPVIVGGTGLYFAALTEGLADIPATPPEIRAHAGALLAAKGLGRLLGDLDAETRARVDRQNPARVLRAWEVLAATGRGMAAWQDATPPPLLPPEACARIAVNAPADWLVPRIEARFDAMLRDGALDEARANLPGWSPLLPAARAIGAAELIAWLRGETSLDAARARALAATRRYAKRQRTWLRARMRDWLWISGKDI